MNVATMAIPAGNWLVTAETNVIYFPNGTASDLFRCHILVNGAPADASKAVMVGNAPGSAVGQIIKHSVPVAAASPSSVLLQCWHDNNLPAGSDIPRFERTKLMAIQADSLDVKDVTG